MRLIDADALPIVTIDGIDAVTKSDLAIAPAVSCEECRFLGSRPGYTYECGTDRPGFGCAYFERREP